MTKTDKPHEEPMEPLIEAPSFIHPYVKLGQDFLSRLSSEDPNKVDSILKYSFEYFIKNYLPGKNLFEQTQAAKTLTDDLKEIHNNHFLSCLGYILWSKTPDVESKTEDEIIDFHLNLIRRFDDANIQKFVSYIFSGTEKAYVRLLTELFNSAPKGIVEDFHKPSNFPILQYRDAIKDRVIELSNSGQTLFSVFELGLFESSNVNFLRPLLKIEGFELLGKLSKVHKAKPEVIMNRFTSEFIEQYQIPKEPEARIFAQEGLKFVFRHDSGKKQFAEFSLELVLSGGNGPISLSDFFERLDALDALIGEEEKSKRTPLYLSDNIVTEVKDFLESANKGSVLTKIISYLDSIKDTSRENQVLEKAYSFDNEFGKVLVFVFTKQTIKFQVSKTKIEESDEEERINGITGSLYLNNNPRKDDGILPFAQIEISEVDGQIISKEDYHPTLKKIMYTFKSMLNMSGDFKDRFGLTDEQVDAIVLAAAKEYFKIRSQLNYLKNERPEKIVDFINSIVSKFTFSEFKNPSSSTVEPKKRKKRKDNPIFVESYELPLEDVLCPYAATISKIHWAIINKREYANLELPESDSKPEFKDDNEFIFDAITKDRESDYSYILSLLADDSVIDRIDNIMKNLEDPEWIKAMNEEIYKRFIFETFANSRALSLKVILSHLKNLGLKEILEYFEKLPAEKAASSQILITVLGIQLDDYENRYNTISNEAHLSYKNRSDITRGGFTGISDVAELYQIMKGLGINDPVMRRYEELIGNIKTLSETYGMYSKTWKIAEGLEKTVAKRYKQETRNTRAIPVLKPRLIDKLNAELVMSKHLALLMQNEKSGQPVELEEIEEIYSQNPQVITKFIEMIFTANLAESYLQALVNGNYFFESETISGLWMKIIQDKIQLPNEIRPQSPLSRRMKLLEILGVIAKIEDSETDHAKKCDEFATQLLKSIPRLRRHLTYYIEKAYRERDYGKYIRLESGLKVEDFIEAAENFKPST